MEQKQLKPKLRFKEFKEEWKDSNLDNYFKFKNGINASKESYGRGYKFINVLDIINNRFIDYESILGEVSIEKDTFEDNKVEFGDVLFQRSSETREEVGQANIYTGNQPVTFGGFVIMGKKQKEYDPYFMNYLLKSSAIRKDITSRSGGSTRYNIGQELLKKVRIILPEQKEQQKIASFLSVVDEYIENLKKQKEALEKYKKGLMQKIFSRQIRFKDENGNEFPEWEERKLGKYLILNSKRNKLLKESLVLSISNKYGFITQADQFENHVVASKDLSNYKLVYKGDFAYNPSRINVGSIASLKKYESGIVSPMYIVFSITSDLNPTFFESFISTHKFKYLIKVGSSGSVRDSLSFEDMEKFETKFPSLKEQNKIAEFLSKQDKLVEAKQQQIEKAEQWKIGLLQQLFI